MKLIYVKFLITTSLTFTLSSCTQTSDVSSVALQQSITNSIFADAITNFKVNVVYEVGATPYTGNLDLALNDTWSITRDSYAALFQNHVGRTLTIPTMVNQMTQIADQNHLVWTTDELLNLGKMNALTLIVGSQINVSVIFLNGTYQGNSSILGVHFTGNPFVFIFKDVVISAGGTSTDQRYVEQATVVHEIGHAVGLVNNGLPMVSSHEDGAHAKHSIDNQCVMYWSVESSTSILSGLNHFILAGQLNLFAADSLADGRAYHP